MDQGDDTYETLGLWLHQLRGDTTQTTLGRRLDLHHTVICLAEQGVRCSARTAGRYDRYFSSQGVTTPGAISTRQYNADQARKREMTEARTEALEVRKRRREVSPAHRRDFLHAATVPAVATVLGEVEEASRAITAGQPDPWTLTELADDATRIGEIYWSTPLDQLLPEVTTRWRQCRDMLRRGPEGATRQRVLELGGHFSYYAARIGRHTGHRRLASGFGTLAAQYAEVSGNSLLIGSVACMRSCAAFDSTRFTEAAEIAGQAAGQAHPYTRARLYAYQSRALAAGGHPDEARDALAEMRRHMVDLPPMPGTALFDEGEQLLYSAIALADIGDRDAEVFAREAIAGIPADQYQAHGLAWVTIGKARADSDPGAAADAGLRALEANRAWPSVPVKDGARSLHRTLARDHGKVAEVVRLGKACQALRPAVDT